MGVYVYSHNPLSSQIASQAGHIRLLVSVIAIFSIQTCLWPGMHSHSLFCFFLPTSAFFSLLKHCQLLLLRPPYLYSAEMLSSFLVEKNLYLCKFISDSAIRLSVLPVLWIASPFTSLSCSNSNFIHDFQINDNPEGKQVKAAIERGLEGMLMESITELTVNWCG